MVIVGIAITLVFVNKSKEKLDHDSNNGNINSTSQTNETYATSFAMNLPNTIKILVGTKVFLLDGYINVTPSSMLKKLTYEISPKSNGSLNGIKFENNIITANSIGGYIIKFKIPKSASVYFTKTINIVVYEETTSSHIYQTSNTMVIGESKNISELFSVLDGSNFSATTDGNITYSNDIITAQNVGDSKIQFNFAENYIKYVYDFEIKIKDEPMFKIVLLNVTNNTINIDMSDNDVAFINFQVKNREEENVTQAVKVSSSNKEIVVDETKTDDVLIKIRAKSTGEATITISLDSDQTIRVDIKVIVI